MPLTEAEKKQILSDRGLDPDKFEVYDPTEQLSKSPEAPPAPQSSALGSFGRAAGRGLIPSLGAAIGGTLPAWLLGPEVGLPVTIGATLLGGGLGAIGAEKAQEAALSQFAPTLKASMDQQAAIDAASHPIAQTLGGVASALPTFEFAPGQAFRGIGAAYRLGRGLVPEAEQAAARAMAYGTGAQLGLGAASGAINPLLEGRTPTAEDIGMGVGQAALLGRHRGWLGSVPGLGFMAHPNVPTAGIEEPIHGQDYPGAIGPNEPLVATLDKSLQIGHDSSLTRLYRLKYGRTEPGEEFRGTEPSIGISESTPVSDVSELAKPGLLVPSFGEVGLPLPSKNVPYGNLTPSNVNVEHTANENVPMRESIEAQSAVLPGMPREILAQLAQGPSVEPRTAEEVKRQKLRKRVSEKGKAETQPVPSVQAEGSNASPGLQKTIRSGVAVQDVPFETAQQSIARDVASGKQLTPDQIQWLNNLTPQQRENYLKIVGSIIRGKSSASPENIAATQAAARERDIKYAAQPVPVPEGNIEQHLGATQRPPIQEKPKEVRKEKGRQDIGGNRLQRGTPGLTPTMYTARRVAKMSPDEFVKSAQSFNKVNLELGRNATPEDIAELKALRDKATDRWKKAAAKAEKTKNEKDIEDMGKLSSMPQFFNEAIAESEKARGAAVAKGVRTPEEVAAETKALESKPMKELVSAESTPSGINDRLNAILAKQGGDPNVKFQEASKTAAELPAEDLLSHPVNADMLAWTKKVADRNSVEITETSEPIITADGNLAAGSIDLRSMLAKYHGRLATVDTGLHEIGHAFFDLLRTSPDPKDRALYERGLIAGNGNEENIAQWLGIRSSELGKARVEGNTLRRFKLWAQDFWSWVKDKFGQATAEDLKNLLARRMVDGELVARGERPALGSSSVPDVRYQRADARTKETTKDVESRDITLPGLRSIGETVKRLPIFGEHLFNKWFTPFYETRDRMLGKYRNEANHILSQLDPCWKPNKVNADAIAERLFAERENPNYTPTEMAPQVEAAYRQIKDLLESAAKEANERGIRVMDGDDFREIIINRRYIPHMMSEEASYIISNKQGSPEYNALKKDYVDWVMRGGLKGVASGVSEDVANSMWKDRTSGSTSVITKGTGGFGPLEMAAGMGLPASMREQRLSNVLNRYFDRYAEKIAWFESVEKDTPENAITRSLLNQTDQLGSRDKNATELEDGQPIVNVASKPEIEHAIKDMLRNYDSADRVVEAFNRGVKALMMQTMTGFADFTGGIFNSAQHLGLMDYLTLTPKAVTNIAKGIAAGRRWNVVQEHAARLQSGSIEGAGYGAPMGNRVDNMVKWANAAADGIYKITGRDAFEQWGRGLLMNLGMLKTEATIGRIRIGRATSADLKWMDTFVGRDKWESMLAQGKDAVTTELQENIAAKFVQSVQGTYDARGLPHWALSGQLSPFFALARWNIEKANNFTKYVINPMRKGDFAPFLKMTLGAAVGGEVIHLFRQMLTDRKPQDANWSEIMESGGAGLDYRLLASMAYTGYAGAMADVLKQAWDIGHGNQAQGFRFPVVSAIQGAANRGAQFAQAIENGENPFELLPQLAVTLGKDNIQMARALTRFASEDEQQQINQSNSLRDLKVYRQSQGIPVPPSIGQQANPFLSPLKRQYQSAPLPQAIQLAPQLIAQAIARSSGDPERLRALMRNYAAPSANVMPSLQTQPFQFKQYVDWLRATQGPAAAQQAVSSYFQKQAEDQVKRALVPSF